mgnify:CR=1 FL=1
MRSKRRNPVKRLMDKLHRPKTHRSKNRRPEPEIDLSEYDLDETGNLYFEDWERIEEKRKKARIPTIRTWEEVGRMSHSDMDITEENAEQDERRAFAVKAYITQQKAKLKVNTLCLLEQAKSWKEELLQGLPYIDGSGHTQRAAPTEESLRELEDYIEELESRERIK